MSLKDVLRPLVLAFRDGVYGDPKRELRLIAKRRQELSRFTDDEVKLAARSARVRSDVIEIFL